PLRDQVPAFMEVDRFGPYSLRLSSFGGGPCHNRVALKLACLRLLHDQLWRVPNRFAEQSMNSWLPEGIGWSWGAAKGQSVALPHLLIGHADELGGEIIRRSRFLVEGDE